MADLDDLLSDPEPYDEDDPENKEQDFLTYKEMNVKPEQLVTITQAFRDEYANWLKEQNCDGK